MVDSGERDTADGEADAEPDVSLATMGRGEPAGEWRYEAIVDAVGDGVYQLDALGRIVTVNDAIVSLTGYDRETLVGSHVSLLMNEADIDRTKAVIRNLLETDERSARSIEVDIGTVDGDPVPCELRLTVVTDDDGALDSTVGVVRDVTERRERKRALHEAQEKYRSVVDDVLDRSAEVGVFILDDEFRVAWMNEAIEEYFGVDRADVVGRDKRTVIEEEIAGTIENAATFTETVVATYDDNSSTEQFECHVLSGDGRRERYLEHRSRPIESGYYEGGRVELYYDVTDRRETELRMRHEKERFRSLVDAVQEYTLIMLDADGTVVSWNDGAEQLTGYRTEEILGEHFSTFFPAEDVERGVPAQVLAAAVSAGKFQTETWRVRKDGSRFLGDVTVTPLWNDDGSLRGFVKVTRDMTDQREREAELRRERDVSERILESSPVAIAVFDADGDAVRVNPQARELLQTDGDGDVSPINTDEWELYDEDGDRIPVDERPLNRVVGTGEPVYGWQGTIRRPDGERLWMLLNAVPITGPDGDVEQVVFAGEDISELKEREQTLERQRDELASLNHVNEVIRKINRTLVGATSRGEILTAVCDKLADADPYVFAWVGKVNRHTDRIEPRAWAGGDESYLDAVDIAVDGVEEPQGPGGRAVATGEVAVVQDVSTDGAFESWREHALDHGFRSVAAIPIRFEERLYGVLGVYADRPNVFDERERAVLAELGSTIGHALNALERKEALMGDSVVELELRSEEAARPLTAAGGQEGRAVFERTIPVGDDSVLQYVRLEGIDSETFCRVVDELPQFDTCRVIDDREVATIVQVTGTHPPITSTVATYGGRVRSVAIEDGVLTLVAELPHSTDVRQAIEAIRSVYSDVEVVSQSSTARSSLPDPAFRSVLGELTDRQRAALEAAYFSGYFDWPRGSTAEEIADSLGISSPTFHQHFRKAERKLLESILADSDE